MAHTMRFGVYVNDTLIRIRKISMNKAYKTMNSFHEYEDCDVDNDVGLNSSESIDQEGTPCVALKRNKIQ